MLADKVTAMLLQLKGQKDGNGRALTPTAVAIYGFRQLEELCMAHASQVAECRAAINRFRKNISAPVDARRFLQLEDKLEACRKVGVRESSEKMLPLDGDY